MSQPGPRLTVVGLGPGDPALRTLGTRRALDAADLIILRTRIHPGIADLVSDPRVIDCDDLYLSADRFTDLYPTIAARVVSRARAGGSVVYAVPGHPRFGERSVALVESLAAQEGIAVEVLDAVSFVDTAASAMRADPLAAGLQIADAEHLAAILAAEPFSAGSLGVDAARPLLVAQIYSAELAAAVKLALSRIYPDEHAVTLIRGAGVSGEDEVREIALHTLDRQSVDHLTSLWAPPLAPLDAVRSPESLARIVARLRAPGGCPWDREQTHATLRDAILEEAYETVDAIDQGDDAGLAEELGDLLLLVMMHAQLAEEAGAFTIEDVFETISRKLIRRHPHVFGSVEATTPGAVIATWEGVKAAERAAKGTPAVVSRFTRLPRSMPATRKAIELLAPHARLDAPPNDQAGDPLLWTIEALIEQGIDPERALDASLRRRAEHLHGDSLAASGPAPATGEGDE